jgi:small-conductance mechanosensitive channel
LAIFGFQLALSEAPVVSGEIRLAIDLLLAAALEFVPLLGLAFAILAPHRPQWRISGLTDDAAIRLFRAMRVYAILLLVLAPTLVAISPVYAEGRFVEVAGLRSELKALGGFAGVIAVGLAMLNLMRSRNWRYRPEAEADEGNEQARGHAFARTMMVLVICGVIASMIVCGMGYINLGVFVTRSMTRTLVLLGVALGLRALLREAMLVATSAENGVGRWLRHRLMLDDAGGTRLVFWLMLIIDIVGGTLVLATVLVMWGLPGAVLQEGVDLAINGVDVGGFELSLVGIGLALCVLFALLTAVRVFQRFLTDRVLVQTRLELGVRDALATGFSYIGYVLAVLITFAVLGLNVGNIALIFGALSVGIGFGLQHVVSNFVSGLILLVQRPIKTGDWIVVGDQQGYVRRISVISTEIQTFDAAAVIVPNSTMLSSQATNWHLHNKLGRVIVAVGVSYDSDPEHVRKVLLACAEQNSEILKRPAPQVLFREFGDSSLDFELRFFLREIDGLLRVSSEMRFALKKAFDEAGIEIPYPQRDLHIRSSTPATSSATSEDGAIAASPIDPAAVSR